MEKTLHPRLAAWLWPQDDNEQKFAIPPRLRRILQYIYVISDDVAKGELTLRAMSLVYTTLLSLVPVIAIAFSVLKAIGVHNEQLEPLLLQFLEPMGEKGQEITANIIGFIDKIKIGLLGTIGVVAVMYTAINLIQKIEASFNYVWRLETNRSLGRRIADYIILMFGGAFMMFAVLGISASVLSGIWLQKAAEWLPFVAVMVEIASRLVPYILIICTFSFFYMFVPNTRVTLKAGLIAGVISGILWQSCGWAFGSFVVGSTSNVNMVIYSGMAILVFFMIWLYLSWLILLVGGSIAFYVQHPEYVVPSNREGGLSNQQKEHLALQVMVLMAERHYQGKPGWNINQYVKRLNVQIQGVQQVINALEKAEMIVASNQMPVAYVPNVPLEETSLKDVLDAIRQADAMPLIYRQLSAPVTGVADIEAQIDGALGGVLSGVTIRDLVKSGEATAEA